MDVWVWSLVSFVIDVSIWSRGFGADQREKRGVRELNGQPKISGLGSWVWFFCYYYFFNRFFI